MSTNGTPKKVLKVPAVVAISNEATAWMFGLESVVSTLVKFCDMSRRMEGGIRLVKYCASCAGMVMMVNRSPSGPSSLGFAVTLMVVPIVPIVTSLVSNPVTRRFVMALPRFATAAL
ncbi:Uncharacterised protein [Mycobacterium tuberculosis]|nr:Uncharacterised protein [Mycobacterium tuberculosis]CNW00491.1 Uncharacterised protein [Mycobacterium tuberculosis]COW45803.1 Uncharacterised protein [Mycobacterium tuberculosis]COW79067.1 Uncharacterised protein [Mycobacterium tuberculosis]COX91964.1 Uncharacterised protein [Mycobacterium tuberculosis]